MTTPQIKPAQPDDFRAIAKLIDQLNKYPQTQCLHSGEGADSIYKQIIEYAGRNEIRFVLAEEDNQLIGVFGSEFDQQLGRGWLWGPFNPARKGPSFMAEMLAELLKIIPTAITQIDSFLNQANTAGLQFYQQQGFEIIDTAHVYVALPPKTAPDIPKPCSIFSSLQTGSLISLHEETFPQAYETGQSMIDKIDSEHQIFVCANSKMVQGYIYATVDSSAGEGYIDFLAVQPQMRGQGTGKSLLLTASNWLFAKKQMPEVGLTVRDKLANARALYEDVGFQLKYSGVATRKHIK